MVEDAKEATGSMGDDTPLAVLSDRYRPLHHFFRQNFSQVTNPPIDSLRENKIMSLKTRFGNLGNILDFDTLTKENIYVLNSPILSNSQFNKFINFFGKNSMLIDCSFSQDENLSESIRRIQKESEIAVRQGVTQLVLSDKGLSSERLPMPMLLCVGAINTFLIQKKLRGYVSINAETGEVLDTHSFATLLGVGATTINPYLALDSLYQRYEKKLFGKLDFGLCVERFKKSINAGLLKIMSKMGICTVASYRGSELFEIIGLNKKLVEKSFKFSKIRTEGIGLEELNDNLSVYSSSIEHNLSDIGGFYKHKRGAETHIASPTNVLKLQKAVKSGDRDEWNNYIESLEDRDEVQIRDLFTLPEGISEITNKQDPELLNDIYKRFTISSMSLGALSEEAHQALAIGINKLGGKSGSGEGGEDPKRFGTEKNSKIKKTSDNKKIQENTKKETKSSSLFSKIKTLATKNLK